MKQTNRRIHMIKTLLDEVPEYKKIPVPYREGEQKRLLRSLMNLRVPKPISQAFLDVQDEYLQEETKTKNIVTIDTLTAVKPQIYLWQGDITRLAVDAIVNAANSGMTGCYYPCHACIDNVIHSAAGIQLRLECAEIMEAQGHEEPTGQAKITKGYNLPAKHVIHTVGPIIHGPLTDEDRQLLASCYRSCLELAASHNLKSIAFCCISTGEFHFPQEEAARIAIKTVTEFLETNDEMEVIFNVFKDSDREIYERLLGLA